MTRLRDENGDKQAAGEWATWISKRSAKLSGEMGFSLESSLAPLWELHDRPEIQAVAKKLFAEW